MSDEAPPASGVWLDAVNKARAAGYTWDDIHGYENTMRQKAAQAGYSANEINGYFGQSDPAPADARLAATAKANLDANPVKTSGNYLEDFEAGLQRSSGGILAHGKPTLQVDPAQSDFGGRLLGQAGEVAGDIPAMTVGAVAASPTGPYGSGAAAMALPQFIKSEYADGIAKGQYSGPEDFLMRQGKALLDTAKAATLGLATGPLGKAGSMVAGAFGAGLKTTAATVFGTQALGLSTLSAWLQGKVLPSKEEVADSAILLGGFKAAGITAEKTLGPVKDNLMRNWAASGQKPKDAVNEAQTNPYLRQNLVSPQPKEPPTGSSATPTTGGDYVIPRREGSFDSAVDWVMQHEGGLTKDTGGTTKYGISQNAHPDIDVKNITPDQAKEIYHSDYWKAIGADKLPEEMRLPAFDAAVNEGVGKAKEMIQEAGGDVKKFLELRAQHYSDLIAGNAEKFGQYANGWFNRLRDLGFTGDRPTPTAEKQVAESAPPAKEPPQAPPQGSEDPWKIVGSHIAGPDEGVPLIDRFKSEAYKAYLDLFDPLDPIHKLTKAINEGESLPDAQNPEFLQRIAEHHVELAQYALKENMTDLEGNVTGPGLEKIIKPFVDGKDLDRFWTFSAAKWGLEKANQAKETGLDQTAIKQVADEGEARYGAAFKQLVEWQNGSLKWLRDAGIISKDNYAQWESENKARIPGYRVMEDQAKGGPGKGGGKAPAFNPIKEFQGSERQIKNVYQSLMRDAFLRMDLAQHNRANVATADLAESLGLATKSASKAVPVKVSADELSHNGIDSDGMDATVFRLARTALKKDEVPVFRDGKLDRYTFDDPYIARYLRGLDQPTRTLFQKMAAPFTKFFRAGVVLNPLFPVRLMGYDVPWQFVTKPGYRNTLADVYTGLRHIAGKSEEYDAWMRSGGAERIFDGLGKDQYIKDMLADKGDKTYADDVWNAVKTPYHALRSWAQLLNQAERVGRFVRAPEGESGIARAIASNEAAFHRSTFGGPTARAVNSIMPFTTAYLNSLDKMVRSFTGHTITGEKVLGGADVAKTYIKAIGVVTIPTLLNWVHNHDKEWYKAAPTWQKDNGLLFNVGSDDGPNAKVIFYKYPPVISFLFGGLPRRLMEAYVADNPHAWDHMGTALGASLAPPGGLVTYNVAMPFIEHVANYSFFRGHPLVDEDTKRNMLPQYQANPYSTGVAKYLSKQVNDLPLLRNMDLSPPVIDNYISGFTGSLGVAAAKTIGAVTDLDDKQPAWKVADLPLISSWMSRYPSANAQPISDFEERSEDIEKAHGSLAATFKAHDFDDFAKLARENPVAASLHRFNLRGNAPPDDVGEYEDALRQSGVHVDQRLLQMYAQQTRFIQKLHVMAKQIDQLDESKMSPIEKRQTLDKVYSWMQLAAERANDTLDKMGGK